MRKLGFIDIGARGGFEGSLSPYLTRLDLVLVEPEPIEARRLVLESDGGRLYRVLESALAHIDGRVPFVTTFNPWCSSVLHPNTDFFEGYEHSIQFSIKEVGEISCHRFDTLYARDGLPLPDLIKIDVQGFEYQVLQGFGGLLKHCLAIKLESHFYEIYKNQRLLGDLITFLNDYGLVLRKLSHSRMPNLDGDAVFDGHLLEVDATFTRSNHWAARAGEDDQANFRLACEIFDVPLSGR
jgi:FkbM family methyltransferase